MERFISYIAFSARISSLPPFPPHRQSPGTPGSSFLSRLAINTTGSHIVLTMGSRGGFKPPLPSVSLSHDIARILRRHRIARHRIMRSSSVAPRRAADHALIRSTKCAQHLERNMPVLMPLARATRWPIYNRDLRPGHPTRPPQPARTIKAVRTRSPSSCSKRMPINVEPSKALKRPASSVAALRVVVVASPSEVRTAATFLTKMRPSSKLRPRAEVLDAKSHTVPNWGLESRFVRVDFSLSPDIQPGAQAPSPGQSRLSA